MHRDDTWRTENLSQLFWRRKLWRQSIPVGSQVVSTEKSSCRSNWRFYLRASDRSICVYVSTFSPCSYPFLRPLRLFRSVARAWRSLHRLCTPQWRPSSARAPVHSVGQAGVVGCIGWQAAAARAGDKEMRPARRPFGRRELQAEPGNGWGGSVHPPCRPLRLGAGACSQPSKPREEEKEEERRHCVLLENCRQCTPFAPHPALFPPPSTRVIPLSSLSFGSPELLGEETVNCRCSAVQCVPVASFVSQSGGHVESWLVHDQRKEGRVAGEKSPKRQTARGRGSSLFSPLHNAMVVSGWHVGAVGLCFLQC